MKHHNESIHSVLCLMDETGETLAETLVSILISALALLLMATTIGSAVRIVSSSRDHMDSYYQHETTLNGGGGTESTSRLEFSVPMEWESGVGSVPIKIHKDDTTGIVYYERNNE